MATDLTPRTVERWALGAVEARLRGVQPEDSLVEFKRELPGDFQKVARRLAGHANAARGDSVLWVVGVDDALGQLVQGTLPDRADPADYWPRIWNLFDGPYPELVDVKFDFDGTDLLALGFRCDRVPYVVRTGKDGPRFEVPWREGTRVETATRSQLLRMMLPVAKAPVVEVRHVAHDPSGLAITFFVIPAAAEVVTLPLHRVMLEHDNQTLLAYELTGNNSKLVQPHPMLQEAKDQAVYLLGPAEVVAKWRLGMSSPPKECRARLTFEPGAVLVVVDEGMPKR